MVFSPYFFKSWFPILEKNISLLLQFVRCSLDLRIYPKLHYLMHYPEIIKRYGPIRNLSTDQFESAHRHFKEQLITSSNHKEIAATMFKGALNKFSYMYSDDYISESCIKTGKFKNDIPNDITNFISTKFSPSEVKFIKSLKYFGYKFKPGLYVFSNYDAGTIFFKKILAILSHPDGFYLVCSLFSFEFKVNIHAYELKSSNFNSLYLIDVSDIWNEPIESYTISGKVYICPPYRLYC